MGVPVLKDVPCREILDEKVMAVMGMKGGQK